MPATEITRHELAHRTNAGLEVSLFWTKVGDVLTLTVYDTTTEELFELEVPKDRALDAFRHPFAYITATDAALAWPEFLAAA
jgi:hypothetical protein